MGEEFSQMNLGGSWDFFGCPCEYNSWIGWCYGAGGELLPADEPSLFDPLIGFENVVTGNENTQTSIQLRVIDDAAVDLRVCIQAHQPVERIVAPFSQASVMCCGEQSEKKSLRRRRPVASGAVSRGSGVLSRQQLQTDSNHVLSLGCYCRLYCDWHAAHLQNLRKFVSDADFRKI
jgi:hypothetical protein